MSFEQKFRRPGAIHAPGYFWFLNSELKEETLRTQIREMAAKGARTVCPHPLPKEFRDSMMSTMTGYLSEEYFKLYNAIVDECSKLNLNCYIYDEGGWPSGNACGQVWASDPEKFSRKKLIADNNAPNGVAEVSVPPVEGHCQRVDILAPGAVEKFLELTHKKYAGQVGKKFGKTINFVFMDEPEMIRTNDSQLTWTKDLPEIFKAAKGYDITPHLRRILANDPRQDAVQYRIDFLDVCSQLFVDRFMIPIRDWCRKHGLISTGHMGGDDAMACMGGSGYGQILRTLRHLDAPGIDVIWRQLWMGTRQHSFPKFASSVAAQGGNKFVVGELFGVYGSGLTFDQMRFLVDYCVVCGVNTFLFCVHPLSTAGGRQEGERPHFGPVNPQWQHIRPLNEYIARLSMLGTLGTPAAATALFFDVRSLCGSTSKAGYADELRELIAHRMMDRQIDFDYIDDDVLETARIEHGKIKIGKARYDQVVIPTGAMLSPGSEKSVARLRKAGIRILSSDDIADISPTLQCRDWRLQVRKRILPGGRVLYFVFNSSCRTVKTVLTAEEKLSVAHCDCETGSLFPAGSNGSWEWEFAPYRTEVFLLGAGSGSISSAPAVPGREICRLDKWQIRPLIKHSAGADDFKIEKVSARSKPVKPGDWAPVLGRDFSGCAAYTADFEFKPGMRFLDLGEVCYSAEVRLNGKKVGLRLWKPYVFDLSPALRPGRNHLEVRVVNTLANAINADGIWETWQQFPFECYYERRQRGYEVESLPSGLYGPVTLLAEKIDSAVISGCENKFLNQS